MQVDGNSLFIPEFGRACKQRRAGRCYQRVRPPNSLEAANIAAGNCSACRPAPLEPEWRRRARLTAPNQGDLPGDAPLTGNGRAESRQMIVAEDRHPAYACTLSANRTCGQYPPPVANPSKATDQLPIRRTNSAH